MGEFIRTINAKTKIVASPDAWIEGKAIQQLEHVSTLEGMTEVAGLPDLHPGRGYPIGMACLSADKIYPALVGSDIGCGMSLWQTDLPVHKVKLDKLEKRLRNTAHENQGFWSEQGTALLKELLISNPGESFTQTLQSAEKCFATIGSGNHFLEVQRVSKTVDQTITNDLGINSKDCLILVHSGSRGLGEAILRNHVELNGHRGLSTGSTEADQYIAQHNAALTWAEINRKLIARRFASAQSVDVTRLLDVNHNFVESVTGNGSTGWLHRKGAAPADRGLVVIPGSRGDISYLVAPTNSHAALDSLAHGAGRKWLRTECAGRLEKRYSSKDLLRTAIGSRVICDNKALLYEEAPETYKPIHKVIDDLVHAGLIHVVAELTPLMTYKSIRSGS
ncbi:MAG: RNA ligase RtcB family protein [Pseudomonadales bacterium]|nr:RNA ligase RtcB family protein [Pseudomonadales bacterium]